jgi:hypothetical protein
VVVATGWSGNMDFMTARNSVAIGHRLVPIRTQHPSYLAEVGRAGQVWAEPDVDEAAAALLSLRREPGRMRSLGDAAAADMASRRAAASRGGGLDALEDRLRTLPPRRRDRFVRAVVQTRLLREGARVRYAWDRLTRSVRSIGPGP